MGVFSHKVQFRALLAFIPHVFIGFRVNLITVIVMFYGIVAVFEGYFFAIQIGICSILEYLPLSGVKLKQFIFDFI